MWPMSGIRSISRLMLNETYQSFSELERQPEHQPLSEIAQ
jgi:hypothetical protein